MIFDAENEVNLQNENGNRLKYFLNFQSIKRKISYRDYLHEFFNFGSKSKNKYFNLGLPHLMLNFNIKTYKIIRTHWA